jgi:hypothetical protein
VAGANHYSTFQQAYVVANPGDVIQVEPGSESVWECFT